MTFEIPVRRIPTNARATIREPLDNRVPEVIALNLDPIHNFMYSLLYFQAAILLPNLLSLRSDINLLKSQTRYITLSANMAGEFRWRVDTELVTMEKQYNQLENPSIGRFRRMYKVNLCLADIFSNLFKFSSADGPGILQEYPDRSRDMFASARIPIEDLVNFLNCYHLSPGNVVCGKLAEVEHLYVEDYRYL